ncbi:MAG TPA: hypothetical protein VKU37_14135 [Verrucomicrobiae bacterium]|nr:hypothetical protein [Verrucomicrobiae bacterium]
MSLRRKILIVFGVFFGVAILVPVIRHYQLRAATEAYIARLKAQGEPMDLAQVIPPPVPPDQNGAPLITNALAEIHSESNYTNAIFFNNPPYDMNRTIPGKEMIGWQQPAIHDSEDNGPTNTWGELGTQLAERQNNLNDFRRLIEKPTLDFNMDYSDLKALALMSHLPRVKLAVEWLETSELYNLHQGETGNACVDVRAMLAFVKGETDERFEISQLVRFAITQMSAGATWDILQTTNVSNEDLAQLQRDWQSLEFISSMKNTFLFERVNDLRWLNDLRQSPTNLDEVVAWNMPSEEHRYKRTAGGTYVLEDDRAFPRKVIDQILLQWDKYQWRWFWSYTDEVRGLHMSQALIDGIQMMETNKSFPLVQTFVKTNFAWFGFASVKDNPYAILAQNASSQLVAMRKVVNAEITRNVVITAIALKRYEIRHHQLPNSLDELVPEFLKAVPIDYMDGQPLRYRRNADRTFLLYSVGENGEDDSGNPSLENGITSSSFYWQDEQALDWVWPQPATEQEVQNYYAHPPK